MGADLKATENEKLLNVLLLAPPPDEASEITALLDVMQAHLTRSKATLMNVGGLRGPDASENRKSPLGLMKRMALLPIEIARRVRREHFDAVHVNLSFGEKSLLRDSLILLALRAVRCRRVLVYFHGWRVPLEQRICKTIVLKRTFAWLLNGAAHIAVIAPEVKQGLQNMGVEERRIVVTRPMFDGTLLKEVMKERSVPSKRHSILFVSDHSQSCGIHELLDAFARLSSTFPDADLIVAGDGDADFQLRSRVTGWGLQERVKFPGNVQGRAKWLLLRDCTLFALPAYSAEAIPLVLIEAMAAGKPVLTSDRGFIRQIVNDPDNGVVLSEVTATAVKEGLNQLLSNPKLCREIGARNKEIAWQSFEATDIAAEIEALYSEIAAGQGVKTKGE